MITRFDLFWRISATSTLTNQHFYCLGLPSPRLGNFRFTGYSTRVPQSQGGEALQGYNTFVLQFPPLNSQQVFTLNSVVNTAITNGLLYMTVCENYGQMPDYFIDISGIPAPLNIDNAPGSKGLVYPGIELKVNNVTIINSPTTCAGF